jgi:diaminobutyrate-2-oxoglutarate transaminase
VPLGHTLHRPYDGFGRWGDRSPELLDDLLSAPGAGVDVPAAVIVETVQGEGGVNVASLDWLRRLAELCRRRDILLIVDDVQAGCGRTGPFFSFEAADIVPDLVCLSKSISGYGLPMALLLMRSDLDEWEPGEHNGTFRGNNAAFVTAAAALESYWSDAGLETSTQQNAQVVAEFLEELAGSLPDLQIAHQGRGLIWGLSFARADLAQAVSREAFARGLIVETSGASDEVVKLLPPLTITKDEMHQGLGILDDAIRSLARRC